MIDATTVTDRDRFKLAAALAEDGEPEVLIFGHVVRLRDIGDACRCCDHVCGAGEPLFEAETLSRVHGRRLRTDSDDLEAAIAAIRELLAPHRIDTDAGRERFQVAENVRTGLQPALIPEAS